MSVSRDQVLSFMKQNPDRPLKIRELARALQVGEREYNTFRRLIRQMGNDGLLVKLRNNRYGASGAQNLITGRLSVHSGGYGLLAREDGEPDIFIGTSRLGTALHGDKVIARLTKKAQGSNRPEGELVRIIQRAEQTIVGTFFSNGQNAHVTSDDPRIPLEVYIPQDMTKGAQNGQKVVAKIQDWEQINNPPPGYIAEVLGDPDTPGIETLILIKKHGLPLEFPSHVEEAAQAIPNTIPAEEIAKRRDIRDTVCVTIDPYDARDHDDAVSLDVLPDGTYQLGIHIADVSYFVTEGSPLDHEALARGTSVYLPDRVIPMLPEHLSAGVCSLRPHEDRLALSVFVHIHPNGDIIDTEIAETIMRSHERLSYENVQRVLDNHPDAPNTNAYPFADMLLKMEKLRQHLTKNKHERGAIDFDLPEPHIVLNDKGFPIDIRPSPRLNSHRLIEEFMLLANEVVAKYMTDRGIPILYRVHESPDIEKLADFAMLAAAFGHRLPRPDRMGPSDIQRILESLQGERIGRVLNSRLLRSMKKALYTPKNIGHFGLACETYTHFTSPIRRYPDLITHRIVRETITQTGTPEGLARRNKRLPDIGDLSTQREIAAQQADWDAIKLMQVLYLEDKVGEHFAATIIDVRPMGFFIELEDILIEGLVHVKTLDDDYYVYQEIQGALIGERTGTTYQLGDAVEVQLARVDRQRLLIDFELTSHASLRKLRTRPPKRGGKRTPHPAQKSTRRGRKRR
jgi:ribonuclease R